MAAAQAQERRGTEDVGAVEARADLAEELHRVAGLAAVGDDPDEVAEGRIAELPAALQLLGQEARDVVPSRVHDRPRVRLERLDDHAAGRIPPAPAGQLGDELERSLLCPEVGHPEAGVGVHDGGERDSGEVVPLGDHLGADEHRPVRLGETPQRRRQLRRAANRVGVEPDPLEAGHLLRELLLEPLRSRADPRELRASRTRGRPRPSTRRASSGGSGAARRRGGRARRRSWDSGGSARRRGSGRPERHRGG